VKDLFQAQAWYVLVLPIIGGAHPAVQPARLGKAPAPGLDPVSQKPRELRFHGRTEPIL
jgi:hypothetical protein